MNRVTETGFRAFNRVERIVGKRLPRSSSYPFLACDTYFSECDLSYMGNDTNLLKKLTLVNSMNSTREISIYCPEHRVPMLLSFLESSSLGGFGTLLVGDSDETLTDLSTLRALKQFKRVFLVNRRSEGTNIRNLPIGLENKKYSSPLRLNYFKRAKKLRKANGLLLCWNDATNPVERTSARNKLKQSKTTLNIELRIPFQVLAKHTQQSYLVACPVGNGIDTHRIWESLYLGSLPVVLKKDASIFDPNWPIHRVDDWEDLSGLTIEKARDIFEIYREQIGSIIEMSEVFIDQFRKKY